MEQLVGVHHHHQPHFQPHRSRDHHPSSKTFKITSPFLLLLLAAVSLLASFSLFSSPTPSLLPSKNTNKAPMAVASSSSLPPSLELFELSSGKIRARISNLGATLTSLLVPDKNGVLRDVVLGFDSLEPYLNGTSPYFGCIVGRVANRIKDGKFTLKGVEYNLAINNPPNSLHGGLEGFDKVIWEVAEHNQGENPSITFKYYSKDGEEAACTIFWASDKRDVSAIINFVNDFINVAFSLLLAISCKFSDATMA